MNTDIYGAILLKQSKYKLRLQCKKIIKLGGPYRPRQPRVFLGYKSHWKELFKTPLTLIKAISLALAPKMAQTN